MLVVFILYRIMGWWRFGKVEFKLEFFMIIGKLRVLGVGRLFLCKDRFGKWKFIWFYDFKLNLSNENTEM